MLYTYIYICVCVCIILRECETSWLLVVRKNVKVTPKQQNLIIKKFPESYDRTVISFSGTTQKYYKDRRKLKESATILKNDDKSSASTHGVINVLHERKTWICFHINNCMSLTCNYEL